MQGVWFRGSCRDVAVAAGVAGWARNLDDGTVEVVLEGEPAAVASVEAWCGRGPSHATVRDVDAVDGAVQGLTGFAVR